MSTARLAIQMRMAVVGARAFHSVEVTIPAYFTPTTAGSWSHNDLQNRKPGSWPTSVLHT